MDPADFAQELFEGINRQMQTGANEIENWIEAQVHGAAVLLLDSLMPPIVDANNTAVKLSESAIVASACAGIGFILSTANLGNAVLAGAVADTVQRGLSELTSQRDYAQGVNSIAW